MGAQVAKWRKQLRTRMKAAAIDITNQALMPGEMIRALKETKIAIRWRRRRRRGAPCNREHSTLYYAHSLSLALTSTAALAVAQTQSTNNSWIINKWWISFLCSLFGGCGCVCVCALCVRGERVLGNCFVYFSLFSSPCICVMMYAACGCTLYSSRGVCFSCSREWARKSLMENTCLLSVFF